jgi:hypothetical protein
MPLKHSKIKHYYKWGKDGKQYSYKPGSERSEKMAKAKAMKQGEAIEISKNK